MAATEEIKVSIIGDASSIETASKKADKALQTVKKGSVDASFALTNLGRVAQDAPYGFIAISNNLSPVLEGFQQLSKNAKGAGQSIGSVLVKSLTGGAGLGLAFSAVTAAITFAQVGLSMWSRSAHGAGAATDAAAKATEKYKASIESAFQNVAQEAAKVEVLVAAIKNENLSRAQRVEGIRKLQQIAPEYFGTLDAEKVSIDQLSKAYERYNAGLLRAAEGKVLEKQLEGIIEKRMELEKALNPQQFVFDEKGNKIRNYQLINAQTQKIINDKQREYNDLKRTEEVITNRLAQLQPPPPPPPGKGKKPKEERDQFNFFDHYFDVNPKTAQDKAKQAVEMYKTATEFALKNIDNFFGLDQIIKAPTQEKTIEEAKKFWADYQKGLVKFKPPVINIEQEIKLTPKVNEEALKAIREQFLNQQGAQGEGKMTLPIKGEIEFGDFTNEYQKKFKALGRNLDVSKFLRPKDDIPKLYEQLNSQLTFAADTVSNTLAPAFQNMFSSIMAGEDPLKSFFQTLGQQVQQLISQLIAAAIQALVLSAITGGGTSFGSAFGKIMGVKLPGMATGGIVPGGFPNDTFPAMLSSGEAVIPLHQLSNLVGNMGSGQPQVIVMQQRLRGRDMILQQARESKAQRRGG